MHQILKYAPRGSATATFAYSILGAATITTAIEYAAYAFGYFRCDERLCEYMGKPVEWFAALGSWAAVAVAIIAVTVAAKIEKESRDEAATQRAKVLLSNKRQVLDGVTIGIFHNISSLFYYVNGQEEYERDEIDTSKLDELINEMNGYSHDVASELIKIKNKSGTPDRYSFMYLGIDEDELKDRLKATLPRLFRDAEEIAKSLERISRFIETDVAGSFSVLVKVVSEQFEDWANEKAPPAKASGAS